MEIRVKIGETEATYVVRQTRAPVAYDGFGTFTLQDDMPENSRLVLIREEHLAWQEGRYGSGLNCYAWDPEFIEAKHVEDALWAKLRLSKAMMIDGS